MLTRLQIANLRNIATQNLDDLCPINVFLGDNGAGKTSVLEAIHTLGYGRSFRKQGGQKDALVQYGADRLVVFAERQTEADGGAVGEQHFLNFDRMGLARAASGEIQIKLNGEKLHRLSDMALRLPAIALNSDTFDLLTGAAIERRRFLDWAVFHVEQNFRELSKRYANVQQQRNWVLRRLSVAQTSFSVKEADVEEDQSQLAVWTAAVASLGADIDVYRMDQFRVLKGLFDLTLQELGGGELGVELIYRCGWAQGLSLAQALEQGQASDINRGFTQFGPHRADVQVVVSKDIAGQRRLARDVLSRGQLKLVVLALKLAQARFYQNSKGARGFSPDSDEDKGVGTERKSEHSGARDMGGSLSMLLDDVAAEFDQSRIRALGQVLGGMLSGGGLQIFITSTSLDSVAPILEAMPQEACKVFHVEQGKVYAAE